MNKLIVLFLFSSLISFSQNLKGTVIDSRNSEPIESVNVYLSQEKKGTITNAKGKFNLQLSKPHKANDTVYFSHVGFKTHKALFSDLIEKRSKIYLTSNFEKLSEVEIVSNKKLSPNIRFETLSNMNQSMYAFGSDIVGNTIYVSGGDFSVQNDAFISTFQLNPSFANMQITLREFLRASRYVAKNTKGYDKNLTIYNIKKEEWDILPIKLRKRAYHNIHFFDEKIYIIGGKRLSENSRFEYLDSKIEVLDLKKNKVSIDHTNPHEAVNPISFLYKDRIIIMGGTLKIRKNGQKVYSNKIHSYNLKTGLWYEIGNIPFSSNSRGLLIDEKVYIVEISDDKNKATRLHIFDLKSGIWKHIGNLPEDVKSPAITNHKETMYFFENGKLFVLDTKNYIIKKYLINLYYKESKMHYYQNKLYILGGYMENNVSKTPSSGLFSINLNQIDQTKIRSVKHL
ncbi:carboxypeptidase-like regulatory domain-containing protein [Aquimarina sp. MMG016]|uniref:Kelch repeat-containing protein n=1 Tax=Aquimarina sp. MMG016 TaxID=2822690 RepID=UPI001B39D8FB|nr:carboxypeptidase-like regulatory domain-containing protein [Aquimarina sp. MMG016]MBQ4819938.1 carboxypeptidase-like regulatory domain-containing protein [Aquimarina sp. MMG016]